MQLNRGQETALQNLLQWWRHRTKQVFEISGAAGTGKTTIVRELINSLGLSNDQVLLWHILESDVSIIQNWIKC